MRINPADVATVADGILINAVWAVGQIVARPRQSRWTSAGLGVAGWMDTELLTSNRLPGPRLELAGLTNVEEAELETSLRRDEVQGALQALLAARLTDAPEKDAAREREVLAARLAGRDAVRLALGGPSPSGVGAGYADRLSAYFDDKISALVATLEGRVGYGGLAQVRAEAYNSRIVAILNKIERQVAALSQPDRGGFAELQFLASYRRHVSDVHGKLQPPDFERRRKVSVDEIYVSTPVHDYADRAMAESRLDVMGLAKKIDRTVLLGDPGGGKTTAANVLANCFANTPAGKIPFLVTLRDYAAMDPPARSVVGHIEHTISTLYQCPAPTGLVDRLLATGGALVIFDGLDELINTYRRRDVSNRVEQFCVEYPLTPVLVTSRLVGYDQARLDDQQFTTYRLGGFGGNEVIEYAHKWFAVQDGAVPAIAKSEAEAFLTESASASDLRSNPLLLSLMCILYRGEGSLPRDRTGIYSKCAELMLRKWDEMRRIHPDLRDSHLIEPAIWHLAWWLFTADDAQVAVTQPELVDELASFLRDRGLEPAEQVRETARDFVDSCSGRMWVLTDTGTTARGDKLYSFTHRTFLEYFAAMHLATVEDTPEDLAGVLAGRLRKGEWEVVGQLAVQIKDRNSYRGADRVYTALLDAAADTPIAHPRIDASGSQGNLLSFLARSLGSVEPSPAHVRRLTEAALDYLFGHWTDGSSSIPLRDLLTYSIRRDELVADEIGNRISAMIASHDATLRKRALQLILELPWVGRISIYSFWGQWLRRQAQAHRAEIIAEASSDNWFLTTGLYADVISIEQALTIGSDLGPLMVGATNSFSDIRILPYPLDLARILATERLATADEVRRAISELGAIGRNLAAHPQQLWVRGHRDDSALAGHFAGDVDSICGTDYRRLVNHDEHTCLGFIATMFLCTEIANISTRRTRVDRRRLEALLHLPVPDRFWQLTRDWMDGRLNFVQPAD